MTHSATMKSCQIQFRKWTVMSFISRQLLYIYCMWEMEVFSQAVNQMIIYFLCLELNVSSYFTLSTYFNVNTSYLDPALPPEKASPSTCEHNLTRRRKEENEEPRLFLCGCEAVRDASVSWCEALVILNWRISCTDCTEKKEMAICFNDILSFVLFFPN